MARDLHLPSPYYEASRHPDSRLIVLRRTELAYPDARSVRDDVAALIVMFKTTEARRVLLDFRSGPPPRNDMDFEAAQRDWRLTISARFERAAVLVKSAAGLLQVNRLNREDGNGARGFRDEREAIAWLLEP